LECEREGIGSTDSDILFFLSNPKLIRPYVLDWYGGGTFAVLEIASPELDGLSPLPFPRLIPALQVYQGFLPIDTFSVMLKSELPRALYNSELYNRSKWFASALKFRSGKLRSIYERLSAHLEQSWQRELAQTECAAYDFSFVWRFFTDDTCEELPSMTLPAGDSHPLAYSKGFLIGMDIAVKLPFQTADLLTRLDFIEQHHNKYATEWWESTDMFMSVEVSSLMHCNCLGRESVTTRTKFHFAAGVVDGMKCELCEL
jgi:hypothetical protein